jgi:putative acetyltransferase
LHQHIILQAKARNLQPLSLETGSQPFFHLAIALYKTDGFECCKPFARYKDDHNSKFMTLALESAD